MRWLFGILLLANLSLFLWKSGDEIQEARQGAPAATVPGVPGLTLLSEVSEPETVADAPSSDPGTSAPPAEEGGAPPPDEEEAPPPGEAESPAEPQPEPAVASAGAPQRSAAPEPEPFCARLGPFDKRKPARDAIADLAAEEVYATLEVEGEEQPPRYIVYLPPARSRQAALETLRELQSKKIDSFVFSRGELRNGISLGIFSQQSSAKRLLQTMNERGYDPLMTTRERETRRYWVNLGPKNSARLTSELRGALQKRYPEAEYQRKACP